MRKRSKYVPFAAVHKIAERKAWEKQKAMDVAEYGTLYRDLLIKNHSAMTALVRGHATPEDFNMLMRLSNTVQSLLHMGIGEEYADVAKAGYQALKDAGDRAKELGRFVLKAHEITAINAYIELHDAQLGIINVAEMNKSIELLKQKKVGSTFEFKFHWGEVNAV